MKRGYLKKPLLFLVLGILFILLFSGYSIKKQVDKHLQQAAQAALKQQTEEKLFFTKPNAIPVNTSIKIYKGKRILELYGDNKLMGRFKIGLGRAPEGIKEKEGDSKTPQGKYYVCSLNSQTKYYFFMGLSYPNEDDAKRGLQQGLINQTEYNSIVQAVKNKKQPPWNTALGGAVGIHGGGNSIDWTYGCIALSNDDMKILKEYIVLNTPVEIEK